VIRSRALERVIPAVAAATVVWTLCDYSVNWAWPELPYWNLTFAMGNGAGFSLWDLGMTFNSFAYDHVPRARFLSYILEHVTLKGRVRLWDYLPPHPSLSLSWLPALLSLIPLRKLLDNWGLDRLTALLCVSLYACSPGFLSCITVLTHPAKALGNVFIILALWQASELSKSVRAAGRYGPREAGAYGALLLTLFAGTFTDEGGWIAYAAVPLLFPDLFFFKAAKERWRVWLAYPLPFALFLGILQTFQNSGRWRGMTGWVDTYFWLQWFSMDSARDPMSLGTLRLLANTYYVLTTHVIPFDPATIDLSPNWPFWGACALLLAGGAAAWRVLSAPDRALLRRMLLALAAFCVFHDRLMARHPAITDSLKCCYYYGAPFSLFFVLPVGLLLGAGLRRARLAPRAAALAGCAAFFALFGYNLRAAALHSKRSMLYDYPQAWGMQLDARADMPLTFRKVLDTWRLRADVRARDATRARFAARDFWLFLELEARYYPRGWRMLEPRPQPPGA
jgi:hypothetical protein